MIKHGDVSTIPQCMDIT